MILAAPTQVKSDERNDALGFFAPMIGISA